MVLVKLAASSRRISSASASSASCDANSAAVTTMTSTPSSTASARSSAGANVSGRSRSQRAYPAAAPAERASMSAVLVRKSSSLRPSRNTRSPRSAIFRASARPIPFVAPSMTTRLTSPAKETDRLCAPNPPVRVISLPDSEECLESRIHRPKMVGPRQRVLRQIDPSAGPDDELVHRVDQRLRAAPHRNVQCEGNPGHREGQDPNSLRAAVLDDAEKRAAAPCEQVETFVHGFPPRRVRQHTLVLRESSPAVHPRPVPDPIERIEVRVRMDDTGVTGGGVA